MSRKKKRAREGGVSGEFNLALHTVVDTHLGGKVQYGLVESGFVEWMYSLGGSASVVGAVVVRKFRSPGLH